MGHFRPKEQIQKRKGNKQGMTKPVKSEIKQWLVRLQSNSNVAIFKMIRRRVTPLAKYKKVGRCTSLKRALKMTEYKERNRNLTITN